MFGRSAFSILTVGVLCSLGMVPEARASEAVKGAPVAGKEKQQWFEKTLHGPVFCQTYGDWFRGKYRPDSALKGLVFDYVGDKSKSALFNMETLSWVSAAPTYPRLDNTPWGGKHGKQNKFLNAEEFLFATASGPAWADEKGSFEDQRAIPGHGNLSYAEFDGYFRNGDQIVLDYRVHGVRILDALQDDPKGLVRLLEVAPHDQELVTRLVDEAGTKEFEVVVAGEGATVEKKDGTTYLRLAPASQPQLVSLLYAAEKGGSAPQPVALNGRLKGGKGISPEVFEVEGQLSTQLGDAWLVDQVPLPDIWTKEPYFSKLRVSDFDFFADGDRALLSTWDGDIWLVKGLKDFKKITWKRYATGFFEPLGLRIVEEVPYVAGRDAIWKLHDLNGDEEADHFEIFNSDVLITNNFHEFQFGLETDAEGNFYFAKASPVNPGGRGFGPILPHNGVVAKVSKDGETLEVIATGLRAPGGLMVGPQGQVTTGENEGTWQPCCKLNYFEPSQKLPFFGTEDSRQEAQGAMVEPIVYFPMDADNSGGAQVWIPEGVDFGIPAEELLHLSYGQSSIYHVLRQKLGEGRYQGGVVRLPVELSSSAQRAAFHPDGSLYVVGFRGWQTNAAQEAGFQRVRRNPGVAVTIPSALKVTEQGVDLTFEVELDEELALDPTSYNIERWNYVRGPQYGSGHFSVDNPDEAALKDALAHPSKDTQHVHDTVEVESIELLEDGKTVRLQLKDLRPAQQMVIEYDLESMDGDLLISRVIQTIHEVVPE